MTTDTRTIVICAPDIRSARIAMSAHNWPRHQCLYVDTVAKATGLTNFRVVRIVGFGTRRSAAAIAAALIEAAANDPRSDASAVRPQSTTGPTHMLRTPWNAVH